MHDGLEGVVVAETELSEVDGEAGRLLIAGSRVEDLAGRVPFEDVCGRLWAVPEVRLGPARVRAFEGLSRIGDALDAPGAMGALRAGVAHCRPDPPAAWPAAAEELVAACAVLAAAWWRRRRGEAPVPPDPGLGHAADYLRCLRGGPATDAEVRALDTYLAAVVDHGMNASTFAARVVASTASDTACAAVAGLAALEGRLHGGAPGPVLDMLDAIGSPERAPAWLGAELAAGRRLMGMGHRVYRVRDPRAAVLERAYLDVAGDTPRRRLAAEVERVAEALLAARHPTRPLRANVEFYTALLLEALGVDRALFTATFAVSRMAGWCAHAREQQRTGRLIRPRSRYVGARPAG